MIAIRHATVQSAAGLATLHGQAFDTGWSVGDLASLLESPGVFAFEATIGDILAGFILCRVVVDEAEVLTIATLPALRRRGVAAALLREAMAAALAAGAGAVFLEVATDNSAAATLYGVNGFRTVGSRPGYYARASGAATALIMRRDLNR